MPKRLEMKDYSRKFIKAVLRVNKDGLICYRKVDIKKKLDEILGSMKKRYPDADFSVLLKLPDDLGYVAPECAGNRIAEKFWYVAEKNRLDEFKDLEPEKPLQFKFKGLVR